MSSFPAADTVRVINTEPTEEAKNPLVVAFKGLSDGLQGLFVHHIALAKHEAKADALEIIQDVALVALGLVTLLIGYVLLHVTAILFASWFAGVAGMAIAALVLTLLNLVGGGLTFLATFKNMKERHYGPVYIKQEIERSTQWAKNTMENE